MDEKKLLLSRTWRRLRTIPLTGPVLVCYVVVGVLFLPRFVSPLNITSIFFEVAVLLPAVLGMQLLMLLGRFDLSVGATASFSGMIAGVVMTNNFPTISGMFSALLTGCLVGSLIGILISRLHIDPLVATLAFMGVIRSLSLVVNDGRIVAGLPASFGRVADLRLGSVPVLVVLAVTALAVAWVGTRQLVIFRRFYAAGNNPTAALRAGINVPGLTTVGYILAGFGASLTGLIQASRTLSASPLLFEGLPIQAITACIIGGSSLAGGKGGLIGAAVGLIVVSATNNLVIMLGISIYWQDFAVGILLLLSVLRSADFWVIRSRVSNFMTVGKDKH